jgi:hypothetical protein
MPKCAFCFVRFVISPFICTNSVQMNERALELLYLSEHGSLRHESKLFCLSFDLNTNASITGIEQAPAGGHGGRAKLDVVSWRLHICTRDYVSVT